MNGAVTCVCLISWTIEGSVEVIPAVKYKMYIITVESEQRLPFKGILSIDVQSSNLKEEESISSR